MLVLAIVVFVRRCRRWAQILMNRQGAKDAKQPMLRVLVISWFYLRSFAQSAD
jgi:hypothetical protein